MSKMSFNYSVEIGKMHAYICLNENLFICSWSLKCNLVKILLLHIGA